MPELKIEPLRTSGLSRLSTQYAGLRANQRQDRNCAVLSHRIAPYLSLSALTAGCYQGVQDAEKQGASAVENNGTLAGMIGSWVMAARGRQVLYVL